MKCSVTNADCLSCSDKCMLLVKQGSGRLYRPGNSTEGEQFEEAWCERCAMYETMTGEYCPIWENAFFSRVDDPQYPSELQYSNGGVPMCSAFRISQPAEPRCDKTIEMF